MKQAPVRTFLLACATCVCLASCSTASPDVYRPEDAQRVSTVRDAKVLNVRSVTIEGLQTGAGAATGAVAGGVAGSAAGGRDGSILGAIGAAAGAVVGNLFEREGTKENADEILLLMDDNERRVIVQAKGSQTFKPGDLVLVLQTGGKQRVMKPAVH